MYIISNRIQEDIKHNRRGVGSDLSLSNSRSDPGTNAFEEDTEDDIEMGGKSNNNNDSTQEEDDDMTGDTESTSGDDDNSEDEADSDDDDNSDNDDVSGCDNNVNEDYDEDSDDNNSDDDDDDGDDDDIDNDDNGEEEADYDDDDEKEDSDDDVEFIGVCTASGIKTEPGTGANYKEDKKEDESNTEMSDQWNTDEEEDPVESIGRVKKGKKTGINQKKEHETKRINVTPGRNKGKQGKSDKHGSHDTTNKKEHKTKKRTSDKKQKKDKKENTPSIEQNVAAASKISLDMDDEQFNVEELTKEFTSNHLKLKMYVSDVFRNKENTKNVVHVTMMGPRGKGQPFYLKEPLYKALLQRAHDKYKLHGIQTGKSEWINNIKKLGLRSKEHDETGRYRRSANRNVMDVLCYDAIYSVNTTYKEIMDDQKYCFEMYWRGVFGGETHKIDFGSKVLAYAETMTTGKLYQWLLEQKGGDNKDKDIAAKAITQEVRTYFVDGAEWEEQVPLDKFMVDADIKDFLIDRVGVRNWDGLHPKEIGYVYLNYPGKQPPSWTTISRESW